MFPITMKLDALVFDMDDPSTLSNCYCIRLECLQSSSIRQTSEFCRFETTVCCSETAIALLIRI